MANIYKIEKEIHISMYPAPFTLNPLLSSWPPSHVGCRLVGKGKEGASELSYREEWCHWHLLSGVPRSLLSYRVFTHPSSPLIDPVLLPVSGLSIQTEDENQCCSINSQLTRLRFDGMGVYKWTLSNCPILPATALTPVTLLNNKKKCLSTAISNS